MISEDRNLKAVKDGLQQYNCQENYSFHTPTLATTSLFNGFIQKWRKTHAFFFLSSFLLFIPSFVFLYDLQTAFYFVVHLQHCVVLKAS